jgi:hypothetical protein
MEYAGPTGNWLRVAPPISDSSLPYMEGNADFTSIDVLRTAALSLYPLS